LTLVSFQNNRLFSQGEGVVVIKEDKKKEKRNLVKGLEKVHNNANKETRNKNLLPR